MGAPPNYLSGGAVEHCVAAGMHIEMASKAVCILIAAGRRSSGCGLGVAA